jgi:hypothetical protein
MRRALDGRENTPTVFAVGRRTVAGAALARAFEVASAELGAEEIRFEPWGNFRRHSMTVAGAWLSSRTRRARGNASRLPWRRPPTPLSLAQKAAPHTGETREDDDAMRSPRPSSERFSGFGWYDFSACHPNATKPNNN